MQPIKHKNVRFSILLEASLQTLLEKFLREALTPALMRQIRDAIKNQIVSTFSKSNQKLSSEAVTWLTDQYFKAIKVNDEKSMSDLVVINEYKLSELDFNDIQLFRNLFLDTTMGPELDAELRRRSRS